MVYVILICLVVTVIAALRSILGYEEMKKDSWLDRVLLALLWLNLTFVLLENIPK